MSQLAEDRDFSSVVQHAATSTQSVRQPLPWWRLNITLISLVSAVFTAWYSWIFYKSIAPFWFNHSWTTDDALQQVYPFLEVKHPGLFDGDIITEVMRGYLAPAHYWLCYGITELTGSPMMMSHWVMLIQVVLGVAFLFAAVHRSAGLAPAFLSVAWLLHTRHTMQRLTGGLPRGWGAPIFTAFLYFALSGNHTGVLVIILLGCLLNPPATMVIAFAYGMILVWKFFATAGLERKIYTRRLVSYVALSPLFLLIVMVVIHRPPNIGQMVSYDVAASMPEFSRPYGRFPFIPFSPAWDEIKVFGLQAFMGRFYNPGKALKAYMPPLVLGGLALISLVGLVRRRKAIPSEIWLFGGGALIVYFMSRVLAFRLYVPNRHLQIPMAVFFISAFCIGAWRAFHLAPEGQLAAGTGDQSATGLNPTSDSRMKFACLSTVLLLLVGGLVYAGSGLGLTGAMNFNYSLDKHGKVFEWLRTKTPERALIAGHPTHMDATQLFAERRAYVTTETTHPFYTRYYEEMKRRTEIALRAHYSASLEELVRMLEPEGIDYFVFRREDFSGENLRNVKFFPPFDQMMKDSISRPTDQYAYWQLPEKVDMRRFPFMPFKDKQSVVVDLKALKEFLEKGRKIGNVPEEASVR